VVCVPNAALFVFPTQSVRRENDLDRDPQLLCCPPLLSLSSAYRRVQRERLMTTQLGAEIQADPSCVIAEPDGLDELLLACLEVGAAGVHDGQRRLQEAIRNGSATWSVTAIVLVP
jgi:hypothetical protein